MPTSEKEHILQSLPIERPRDRPLDPPAEFLKLREAGPIVRMVFPDGHLGWLVTGHTLARHVLSDPVFSSRPELQHIPLATMGGLTMPPAAPGQMSNMDAPEHTRYRRMLLPHFTRSRMEELRPGLEQIIERRLDIMASAPSGEVDLASCVAHPITFSAIGLLLGIPADDQQFSSPAEITDVDGPAGFQVFMDTMNYLGELIRRKRAEPADDLLGRLVADTDLSDGELINMSMMLIIGGTESTAHMILSSVLLLLQQPDQRAEYLDALATDYAAVDELVRFLSVSQVVMPPRTATADTELGDVLVRAGETVAVSLTAANHDPSVFDDPARLRLDRAEAGRHVGFGHGIHRCIGSHLARIEVQQCVTQIFRRFPRLRLDQPLESVPMREKEFMYGPRALRVRW